MKVHAIYGQTKCESWMSKEEKRNRLNARIKILDKHGHLKAAKYWERYLMEAENDENS